MADLGDRRILSEITNFSRSAPAAEFNLAERHYAPGLGSGRGRKWPTNMSPIIYVNFWDSEEIIAIWTISPFL